MRYVELEQLEFCGVCGGGRLEPLATAPHVSRCCDCNYLFQNPRPTEGSLSAFYSERGKYDHWLEGLAGREAMWRQRLRELRRHVRGGRLLDVGAGIGHFLQIARQEFEVYGTEVSEEAVRIARDRFEIELIHGPVESAGLPESSFDVVTLIHVVEHLVHPLATLRACWNLTRPGGWLFVAVPNDGPLGWFKARNGGLRTLRRVIAGRAREIDYSPDSPLPRLDLEHAGSDAEAHLSHFGPESLCSLIAGAGFEVVRVGLDPFFASTGRRRLRDRLELRFWAVVHALTGLHAYEATLCVARKPV